MTEQIWFKDPSILFTKDSWNKFVPMQGMSTMEQLNSVVRFTVYFSLLLFFATGVTTYVLVIPIVMVATVVLFNIFPNGTVLENFKLNVSDDGDLGKKKYTMPTKDNPFMNPLLTEIQDNPNREDAAPINLRKVKREVYKNFQKTSDIYMDTSDLFDQTQAMRTFHTLQSAKIPNDQDGFLRWLAKGIDEPDYSSAAPSRNAKVLSEGYVHAKGSMSHLTSSTDKPEGTTPSGFVASPSTSSRK